MYKPGAILKVTVNDFVTYTYAELYPGKHLNLLIGPNGSGKSTMVAAIILGLGGSPKTVGRGKKISDYVKYNCTKSSIVILLQGHEPDDTFTITREFDKTDHSTWALNGTKKLQKDIVEHIKMYNIQVDNLCQFLPQDKVADFAKLNKQELLNQTQVALCRYDLIEQQSQLATARDRHRYLITNLEQLQKKLKQMTDFTLRLESKVSNYKKKEQYSAQIKHLARKRAWVKHLRMLDSSKALKNKLENAKVNYEKISNSAKPMKDAISKLQNLCSRLQQDDINCERELLLLENSFRMKNDSLRSFRDAQSKINNEKLSKLKDLEVKDTEIANTQMKLDQIMCDKTEMIQKYGDDDKITGKLQSLNTQLRAVTSKMLTYDDKKVSITQSRRQKDYEIRSLENELNQVQNIKDQRLNYLKQVDDNAYQATVWLRQNKHLFQGEVYEPIMLELNVINPENALYVENSIAFRDKVAFTCTNKDDMNLLIRSLNVQKNLRVNVIYSDYRPRSQFHPHHPIEHLRKYGFQTYVSSLFTAPGPIVNYLCKTNGIHNIPVAFENNNISTDNIPREIKHYYKGKFRISQTVSKYTRQKIVKQNQITSDKSLSLSYDQIRIENISGQLEELKNSNQSFVDQIRNIEEEITEMNAQSATIKGNMQTLRGVRQKHEGIENRIRLLSGKIQQIEANNSSKEQIESECKTKLNELAVKTVSQLKEVKRSFKAFSNKLVEFSLGIENLDVARGRVLFLEHTYRDLSAKLEEATAALNAAKEGFKNITCEVNQTLRKAKDLSGGFSPEDEGFDAYRHEYDSLSNDFDELFAEENTLVARIECLINAADQSEMNEYEKQLRSIDTAKVDIENENKELNRITSNMDAMLSAWLEPLQELIGQISKRFSGLFAAMECAGEVNLHIGEDERDFEEYGITISVTYRNGEPLQELNNVVQSGGERAVATAAYMLSLQDLTPVPFRCVDEVNQGMDSSNERRIFELIVQLTSKPNTPQYFLITPKLIPNLKYVPTMKVHVVHNGPFVCNHNTWNSRRIQH